MKSCVRSLPARYLCRLLLPLSVFAALPAGAAQTLDDLQWVTEEYAPYNYSENGVPKGIFVDVLQKMWAQLGMHRKVGDIQVLPWARGYRMAQDTPGVCLFSMTVTEPRRKLFKMIGPVVDSNISAIAAVKSGIKADKLADLDRYRIGVVRDDIGEQALEQGGSHAQLVRADSAKSLVRMLEGGRFDLIAYGFETAAWNMKLEHLDATAYAPVFTLKESYMAFACQKDTDPKLIARLQEALDAVRASGDIDRIRKQYLK